MLLVTYQFELVLLLVWVLIFVWLLSFVQKQRAQFDTETEEKVAQAELDTVPSLEVKHAHGRLELRERQLQELAGTMSELSTEEVGLLVGFAMQLVHALSFSFCCNSILFL